MNAQARRRKDAKVGDLAQRSGCLAIPPHARWWVARQSPLHPPYGKPPNRLAPPPLQGFGWGGGGGGGEGRPRVRLFGFSPEGGTSLPLVRQPPDRGG